MTTTQLVKSIKKKTIYEGALFQLSKRTCQLYGTHSHTSPLSKVSSSSSSSSSSPSSSPSSSSSHHPYHYEHQKDLVFVFDLSIFQTSCSFPNKLLPPRPTEKFHICVKACPDTGDFTLTAMFSIDHENHCQAVEFYAEWTLMPSNVSYQVSTK